MWLAHLYSCAIATSMMSFATYLLCPGLSLSFSLCASDPNAWKMLSQLRWPNFFKAYFTNFSRKHLSEPKCCQTASLRGPWSQHNDHTSGTHSFIFVHAHTKCWDLLSSSSSHRLLLLLFPAAWLCICPSCVSLTQIHLKSLQSGYKHVNNEGFQLHRWVWLYVHT